MPPLVSICLPTLNARKFLEPRIESILAQTIAEWELIVCDSFSDDGTWECLQKLATDKRVRLYQVPREGLYAGWNECLRRAAGEYVYIATADDTCRPELLETMAGALERTRNAEHGARNEERKEESKEVGGQKSEVRNQKSEVRGWTTDDGQLTPRPIDIAVCDFQTIDEAGRAIEHTAARWPRKFYGEWMTRPHIRDGRTEFLLHACLGIIWWTITAVLFRKDLLDRIGLFRTDRGSQADEEWEMRAALSSDIVYVPGKLTTWRVHDAQLTAHLKRFNRTALDCLEAVLDDPFSCVPVSWKEVADWRGRITHVGRMCYLDSLNMYRGVLQRDPRRFFRGAAYASLHEPGFFLKQAVKLFPWSKEMSPDPVKSAEDLIRRFNAVWPPMPV